MLGGVDYPRDLAVRMCETWMRGRRLVGFPRKHSHRLPLLDVLAQDFEPGRAYTAVEIDDALREWNPDTATLRRYLVDEGFLERFSDGSRWWRCGGTVDLDVAGLLADADRLHAERERRKRKTAG